MKEYPPIKDSLVQRGAEIGMSLVDLNELAKIWYDAGLKETVVDELLDLTFNTYWNHEKWVKREK